MCDAGCVRKFIVGVLLAATGMVVAAESPIDAAASLKFTGKISGGDFGTSLLFVATDGTAVRAVANESGSFSVAVPSPLVAKFNDFGGSSIQVVQFGYYVGPVNLGGPKVWRLAERLPAEVNLGTIKITDRGGTANVAPNLRFTGNIRMKVAFNKARYGEMLWTETAGDADGDGTPNLFDADADGNGVSDSEQLSQDYKPAAKDMGKLNSRNVMTINFGNDVSLRAQFSQDQRAGKPINTNIVPDATLEQLQAYQASALRLQTGEDITKGKTAFLDCAGHDYCPGEGQIQMLPSEWDPKKSYGQIDLPIVLTGTGHVSPEGHTNIIVVKKGAKIIKQKAAVVSGAVAAPAVIASVGGVKVDYPINFAKTSLGSGSMTSLRVELYRPQVLRTKPSLFMADRGGFLYEFRGWTGGKQGPCRAANVQAGPGLVAVNRSYKDEWAGQTFWDSATKPDNGQLLSFVIDIAGCAKNSKETQSGMVGSGFAVDVFDSRDTRMNLNFMFPS